MRDPFCSFPFFFRRNAFFSFQSQQTNKAIDLLLLPIAPNQNLEGFFLGFTAPSSTTTFFSNSASFSTISSNTSFSKRSNSNSSLSSSNNPPIPADSLFLFFLVFNLSTIATSTPRYFRASLLVDSGKFSQ